MNFNRTLLDSTDKDGKRIPSLMSRIAREMVQNNNAIAEFLECIPDWKSRFVELLRESYFWIIYNSLNEHRFNDAWEQFSVYNDVYAQYGPSEFHSKILGLAERYMKDENQYRFLNFFADWVPANLREQDWEEKVGKDGDTYKPLALKCLKKAFDLLSTQNVVDEQNLTWLIDSYKIAVSKFPADEWTMRSLGILYYRAGNLTNSEKIYKDLSLKLGDKYYIWNEFASCVQNIDVKIGMLCKAISLEHNEDFIGKIRVELAEHLIMRDKKAEAALEIKLHKDHYTSRGWNIKSKVTDLEALCGQVIDMPNENKTLYNEYIPYAEEFAYADVPSVELVLVDDWKNEDGKKFQKYVDGQNMELLINVRKFPQLRNAKHGQVWQFKLHHELFTAKYNPLAVKRSHIDDWSVLPECYGYVNYVNKERKVYHIYTQYSDLIYEKYVEQNLSKGDFVCFRQYKRTIKGEIKINIYQLKKVAKADALYKFPTSVVAVDGVNDEMKLFHFIQSSSKPSGVIHYDQTLLRPGIGDLLRIYYYVRKRKEVRRPGEDLRITEVIHVETTDEVNGSLVKEYKGTLRVKYHNVPDDDYREQCGEEEMTVGVVPDFAFVGDYYVSKSLLKQHNIIKDCEVKCKALWEKNNKWKVFWLEVL